MTWVKLDDAINEHPKLAQVGGFGLALQVAALAYCNRNLTDGYLARNTVTGLVGWELIDEEGRVWNAGRTCGMQGHDLDSTWIAERLCHIGIWHDAVTVMDCDHCRDRWPDSRTHGYLIHDFPDFQPSRDDVVADRSAGHEAKSRAGRKGAEARWGKKQDGNPNGTEIAEPIAVPMADARQSDGPVPVTRTPRSKTSAPQNVAIVTSQQAMFGAICEAMGYDLETLAPDDSREIGNIAAALVVKGLEPGEVIGYVDWLVGAESPIVGGRRLTLHSIPKWVKDWRAAPRVVSSSNGKPKADRLENLRRNLAAIQSREVSG